jgi:hypothetical protein
MFLFATFTGCDRLSHSSRLGTAREERGGNHRGGA